MSLGDLFPTRKKLKEAFSLDYWRGRTVWWYLEQLLSLAFVVLALFHAHAIADYKSTIQSEVEERGCYDLLQNGVNSNLYNQSKLPDQLQKENYEEIVGADKEKSPSPENEFPELENNYSER
jgi:hypothetical protein